MSEQDSSSVPRADTGTRPPPVPPEVQEVVDPVVAADIAADAAGQARPKSKALPPPGTDDERWWERSAVRGAIGTTILFFLPALGLVIRGEAVDRAMLADAVDNSVRVWLVVLGVLSVDREAFRRKRV